MTSRIRLVLAFAAALWSSGGIAASTTQTIQTSGDSVWQIVTARPASIQARTNLTGPSTLVRLNKPALDTILAKAPAEASLATTGGVVFSIPRADGTFAKFRVADSPILAPELAAAFPDIRTYTGQGIDDPTATARFGWTAAGFHAIVLSGEGTLYVDPYTPGDVEYYVAVNKPDVQRPDDPFICLLPGSEAKRDLDPEIAALPISHGATLRTYRLALAATGEYTTAAGGTKDLALSRIVATINRVNGIYERELAVRFDLKVGNGVDPTQLIYLDGLSDPYANNSGSTMLGQNQINIDAVVGPANYDFGHVFSTGGGGVAGLGVVCNAGQKARGVTGSGNPTGDGFDVDYVAHEMGHQFGGSHTFNGTAGNCVGGNRFATHAYEVGSGSTIQAYAGICTPENLQRNSDDYFSIESLNEMTAFITGAGNACAAPTVTGNTIPTVGAGSSFTIPVSTPFTLTASGSDPDPDTLTYDWEQYNLGAASTNVLSASTDDGSRPILRSYLPTTSPSRTFPKLQYILNNANAPPSTYFCSTGIQCLTGEILPTTDRTMTFHVTARDNRAGGGAIATASTTVRSIPSAGPFLVTAPDTPVSVAGNVPLTVSWNVANTSAFPVSATNVTISLSTDGGLTFPTVLLASTPNDGTQSVTVPNATTTQARIKVQGAGNIFFDVSNTNFTINAVVIPPPVFADDPLTAGTTLVKAVHITELRAAIDTLRGRYGLGSFPWTDSSITAGMTVQAVHLTEMRTALIAAYVQAGQPPPAFPAVTAFTTVISVADIAALRTAVNVLW